MNLRRPGNLEFTLWLIVFLITAIFQFWRQVPEDGVMFIVAIISLTVVWSRTRNHEIHQQPRSKAMNRSIFLWSAIAVLMAIWELASYIIGEQTGKDYATPTVSMLVAPFIAHPLGLLVFVVAWMWIGFEIVGNPEVSPLFQLRKFFKMIRTSSEKTGE